MNVAEDVSNRVASKETGSTFFGPSISDFGPGTFLQRLFTNLPESNMPVAEDCTGEAPMSLSGRRRRRAIRMPREYDPEDEVVKPQRESVEAGGPGFYHTTSPSTSPTRIGDANSFGNEHSAPSRESESASRKRMRTGSTSHAYRDVTADIDDSMWNQVVDLFTPAMDPPLAGIQDGLPAGRCSSEFFVENVPSTTSNSTYCNGHKTATWMFQNRSPSKPAAMLRAHNRTQPDVPRPVQSEEFWAEWPHHPPILCSCIGPLPGFCLHLCLHPA
jgi:hypothetical protein